MEHEETDYLDRLDGVQYKNARRTNSEDTAEDTEGRYPWAAAAAAKSVSFPATTAASFLLLMWRCYY